MMENPSGPADEHGEDGRLTRRAALGRLGAAGLFLATGGEIVSACSSDSKPKASGPTQSSTTPSRRRKASPDAPNVLLIVADDMRYDQMPYVPNVRRLIAAKGRSFNQARCNVPLCQPARVGLMTGQTSKHNGELGVGFSGTELKDNDNCLGKWMSDAGYRCGFFGKYINFTDGFGGIDAPAGYETWREILAGEKGAYQFPVHRNTDKIVVKGQYGTDYLAAETLKFIRGDTPFYCVVTPTQPHTPFFPRKDLAKKFLDVKWPIVDEVDVSDKPKWIQELPPLTAADKAKIRRDATGSAQELAAVDDMVGKILTGMDQKVLDRTVVIFSSDNGVHRGEHRRLGAGTKAGPYEVGLRVPIIIRGPGFAPGPAVTAPSLAFQDLPATILDVGSGTAGLPHQDGISLAKIAANPDAFKERLLLHEIGQGFEKQTGDGITTGPGNSQGFRKLYRYPSVRKNPKGPFVYEAYDLDTDPDELSSWANDASRRPERDALEKELLKLLNAP